MLVCPAHAVALTFCCCSCQALLPHYLLAAPAAAPAQPCTCILACPALLPHYLLAAHAQLCSALLASHSCQALHRTTCSCLALHPHYLLATPARPLLASRSCPALHPHYLLAAPARPCSPPALFIAHAQHSSCFLPAVHAALCSYVCPLLLHLPGYVPTASLLFILCPTNISRSCPATSICVAFAAVPANSVPSRYLYWFRLCCPLSCLLSVSVPNQYLPYRPVGSRPCYLAATALSTTN